jgi:hypothetical protein
MARCVDKLIRELRLPARGYVLKSGFDKQIDDLSSARRKRWDSEIALRSDAIS